MISPTLMNSYTTPARPALIALLRVGLNRYDYR
jgi:hypothetical protein